MTTQRLYRVRMPSGEIRFVHKGSSGAFGLFEAGTSFEEIAGQKSEVWNAIIPQDKLPGVVCAPVAPSKIVCIGLNYRHHALEMNKPLPREPLMFLKPPTAVVGHQDVIELPAQSELVHHEGELAVVIKKTIKNVSLHEAQEAIFGYTCANDVTARDIQRRESRYTRGKGFDTFCPLGPYLVCAKDFVPEEQYVECRVNDELRQRSGIDDLIFKIPELVSFVSQVMTLHPGDVMLTGTPMGVGELHDGDIVEVEVGGLGVLRNTVKRT